MRKVLITGAAGFVRRYFVRHFLEQEDEVHAVDCVAPLTGARDPDADWPFFEPRDYARFRFFLGKIAVPISNACRTPDTNTRSI